MPAVGKKPGVVITAQVVLWCQAALILLAVSGWLGLFGGEDPQPRAGKALVAPLALTFLAFAVLLVVLSVKLGSGHSWARNTIIVLELLGVVLVCIDAFRVRGPQTVIEPLLALTVLLCLVQARARQWCEPGR